MSKKKDVSVSKESSGFQEKEKETDLGICFWYFFIISMIASCFAHYFLIKLEDTYLMTHLFHFLSFSSISIMFFFFTVISLLINIRKMVMSDE